MLDKSTTAGGGSPPPLSSDCSQSDEVSIQMRTEALLRGLVLVLKHHGASDEIQFQLVKQLNTYLGMFLDESVWVKHVKHALTYPLAKYLRNEPPKSTGNDLKFTGDLKKWVKIRLSCFNRRNTHLWYSWFQAKRCALPMSDDFVDQTYTEHFNALVREDDGDDNVIDEIFEEPAFQLVLSMISDTVSKTCFDGFEEIQPSTNACFEAKRKEGGQQGCLLNLCAFEDADVPISSELYKMVWYPKRYSKSGPSWNACLEIRERSGRDQWNRLVVKREQFDATTQLSCIIQAVLEPMKVRVISKGEALPYYSIKPLQKTLWRALQQFPCFRLTSRPFSPCDVQDLRQGCSGGEQWFSIDYSAATDGLSWKYSGRILQSVISGLGKRDQEIAMQVLGPHRLYYPQYHGNDDVVFKGVMRRGQLMGSILSFPILCLANLGVYLRTMRDHHRTRSIGEQLNSVLVNGDDMLYAAPAKYWTDHINIGAAVGLQMSIGKSYHHNSYANINSTSVHCDLRDTKSTPWQIDFLNVGLFFGQHKVQNRQETAVSHHDIGITEGAVTIIPTLLSGCLPGRRGDILKMYISLHSKEIARQSIVYSSTGRRLLDCKKRVMSRNMFLPISIGGFGVVPPVGFKYRVTLGQRNLARMLYDRSTPEKTTSRPIEGYDVITHVEIVDRPWSFNWKTLTVPSEYNLTGVRCSRLEFKHLRKGFLEYSNCSHAVVA